MKLYKYLFFSITFFFILSKLTYALEFKPMMSLELAKKMVDACEFKRSQTDWRPLNIAIVDSGADLILFRRQDGAFLGSVEIALAKAKSSAVIPVPTRVIAEIVYGKDGKPGRVPGLVHVDSLVAFPGGLPIKTADGHLIGAIGVSGARGDQDEECAQYAIDSVKELLK